MKRTALFPGSFDPFTLGHSDIVERSLSLFDEVVVGIGVNDEKKGMFSPAARLNMIATLYAGNERVHVSLYKGLTVDFAKEVDATVIVRGVRSVKDFEYERDMADVNRRLSGVETVLLYSEPACSAISSSLVRELLRYGKDVSAFLPKGMILENR